MSDLIRIIDLKVWPHIGVPEEERAQRQRLLISVEMRAAKFPKAALADDLALTLNYALVAERIKTFVVEKPRKLLETLAEDLAQELLGAFPIRKLRLEIKKFIIPNTKYVSVEIERKAAKRKKATAPKSEDAASE